MANGYDWIKNLPETPVAGPMSPAPYTPAAPVAPPTYYTPAPTYSTPVPASQLQRLGATSTPTYTMPPATTVPSATPTVTPTAATRYPSTPYANTYGTAASQQSSGYTLPALTPAPPLSAVTPVQTPQAPLATNILQGGVWGNIPPRPSITNYPTEAQLAPFIQKGIPGTYANWLAAIIGDLNAYYTPERGGADMAARDYQNLAYLWQGNTGRALTADELARIMQGFQGYAMQLGRTAGVPDLFDYVSMLTFRPRTPPPVSYLRVGEI